MSNNTDQPLFEAVHPVLPSQDVAASIKFYVHKLGFSVSFADHGPNPKYAGISRDSIEIHLQWHDKSEWDKVDRPMLRFLIKNVDTLFDEYKGQDVFHENTSLRNTNWDTREFAFYDPFMNGLTFYCDL